MKTHQKSKTNETQLIGSVIAAICIVIYLFAMVQAAVRIYLSVDQRKITSEQEFTRLHALATSAGRSGFMDNQFIDTINSAIASARSIEALIITGPEGEYAFERQQGRAITWVNNSPRFINKISLSKQTYSRPLQIHDIRNANIRAVAGAFDYSEFSRILKDTLLLILIGFAVSFFTMLVQLLLGKQSEQTEPVKETIRETVYVKEAPASSSAVSVSSVTPEVPVREVVYTERQVQQAEESGPKGLYSPRSNIGWEEYTQDRLDSELHRCASTEKDLVLIFMEFTDITNDTMFKQAAEEAVSFFTSRDLLFEFDDTGITAILPGIDLDTGITKSEKFFQRVMEKFPNSFNSSSSLCIGLSSRAGRLLNADRLMFESSEALSKAKKSPRSPIIAFKSDPEKYRAFIASQS